jgi:hypothetical protein
MAFRPERVNDPAARLESAAAQAAKQGAYRLNLNDHQRVLQCAHAQILLFRDLLHMEIRMLRVTYGSDAVGQGGAMQDAALKVLNTSDMARHAAERISMARRRLEAHLRVDPDTGDAYPRNPIGRDLAAARNDLANSLVHLNGQTPTAADHKVLLEGLQRWRAAMETFLQNITPILARCFERPDRIRIKGARLQAERITECLNGARGAVMFAEHLLTGATDAVTAPTATTTP